MKNVSRETFHKKIRSFMGNITYLGKKNVSRETFSRLDMNMHQKIKTNHLLLNTKNKKELYLCMD